MRSVAPLRLIPPAMTKAAVQKRIEKLRAEIDLHNHLYYLEARPEISDQEYDRLYGELQQLESENPGLITPDSPTQRVGGEPLKEFRNVRHLVPMLSLEKAENEKELDLFEARVRKEIPDEDIEYVVEPKIDGVSLGVHYTDGVLTLGVTRGNGVVGDDITANVRTIRAIPLHLHFERGTPSLLEVRGEAYMAETDRIALNEGLRAAAERTFKNTRNATAGSLKLLDSKIVATRRLRAVFYGVGAIRGIKFASHEEELATLKRLGLPTPELWFRCKTVADARAKADEIRERADEFPYEIDGVVIKINSTAQCRRLGLKTNAPASSIAYKKPEWAEERETRVREIAIQVGRTGVLTPVAKVEPVDVEGTTISNVTLHNADEIRRKDVRIGDHVIVKRAGRVIPAIVRVVDDKRTGKEKKFSMPTRCPVCGSPAARREVASGAKLEAAYRCENPDCSAQRARRIEYFAGRDAMDIEGLGGVVADKLVERGLVRDPLDLFAPDFTASRLSKLNLGTTEDARVFGAKNADKVLEAVDRARHSGLGQWLHALGIPNVGKTLAHSLAAKHSDLSDLAESTLLRSVVELGEIDKRATEVNPRSRKNPPRTEAERTKREREYKKLTAEIARLTGELKAAELQDEAGPIVARSVLEYFASSAGRKTLRRLKELGIDPQGGRSSKTSPTGGKQLLLGKRFVVTGTLSVDRPSVHKMIWDAGGEVGDSVGAKTDFLVIGAEPGSTKVRDAEKHGIRVIDEAELRLMLDSPRLGKKGRGDDDLFSWSQAAERKPRQS